MPYISRIANTKTPWIKTTPEEALEMEEQYGDMEVILVPTHAGLIEIRKVSEEEAAELAAESSENWMTE